MAKSVLYYMGLEKARSKQPQHLSLQKGKRKHKSANTIVKSELTRGINSEPDIKEKSFGALLKGIFGKKGDDK